jgi:hypothetical protein
MTQHRAGEKLQAVTPSFGRHQKIKFTFPVSFGCLSPVLSVEYVHTLLSEQEKNSSK